MTPETRFVEAERGRWLSSRVGEELVLLDDSTGRYFRLNEVGTVILEHLRGGSSLADVHAVVVSTFACPAESAWADILALVTDLTASGIVSPRA